MSAPARTSPVSALVPVLLVSGLYLLLYLAPLGLRPLFVPDETRYAEIPREMLASGDWLVPRLNGLLYFEKPPLGYWVHAASLYLFGYNKFALRLPSALAVAGTAVLLILLGRAAMPASDGRRQHLPWLLAAIYLTCIETVAVGTFTVLDSLLTFFLTATVTALFFAVHSSPLKKPSLAFSTPVGQSTASPNLTNCLGFSSPAQFGGTSLCRTQPVFQRADSKTTLRRQGMAALAGLACGCAFLTKGFLAFAVPALAVFPWLAWRGGVRSSWCLGGVCLGVALAVVLPWGVAIQLQAPDFWRFFVWNEHIRRFLAANAQHAEPAWFFLLTAPAMFLPWSLTLPAVAASLGPILRAKTTGDLARLALCWFALPFVFFSASHGKLLTYILPCLPPFAILTGLGIVHAAGCATGRRLLRLGGLAGALLFGLAAIALVLLQTGYLPILKTQPYARGWKWLLAANGLALMAFFCFQAARNRQRPIRAILCMALAPALLLASLPGALPDLTIEKKAPGPLLVRHRDELASAAVVLADEETLQAVCWFARRADVFMVESAGELAYGVGRNRQTQARLLDIATAAARIAANPGQAILVARARNYRRWRTRLPPAKRLDTSGPDGYVLARY